MLNTLKWKVVLIDITKMKWDKVLGRDLQIKEINKQGAHNHAAWQAAIW